MATAGTNTEPGPAADPAAIFGETLGTLCKPGRSDSLIALVPDPVHTRLALDFDRLIEVIQEATQDGGFQFVGADLPWDAKAHPESDDIAVRLNDHAYKTAKEDFPGLLTFRGPPPEDKPLFVWLIGESPTGGIARTQFSQAMKWIAKVAPEASETAVSETAASETTARAPAPPLRILGPNFSGSLSSLANLLTRGERLPGGFAVAGGKAGAGTRCLVFSGSITNRSSVTAFLRWESGRPVRFATFQEADDVLIERFKEYIAGSAYGNGALQEDSIAVLSEDETEYGDNAPTLGCRRCTWLHFPREISRLRAAYQGVDARNGEAQGGPYTILPLNLEISGADDDTVPPYSKQSPLSQEGVLLSIVSELRKHAIQFIILRATDPIDVLFLSRYLGAAYPKARIVTLGADVLFSRERWAPTSGSAWPPSRPCPWWRFSPRSSRS